MKCRRDGTPPCTEEEVVQRLKEIPLSYQNYLSMRSDWKTQFLDFCTGKRTLPLTYDPFFKKIFHPDIHPNRLSRFLSSLLGMSVKVKSILPSEDILMTEGSLLIMDILVELEDGSLANVEIQKIPYTMPGERMSCYSADLLLRQYSRLKSERGKDFTYRDMKKVYTIILYEESIQAFHDLPGKYIHYGETIFNTGLNVASVYKGQHAS